MQNINKLATFANSSCNSARYDCVYVMIKCATYLGGLLLPLLSAAIRTSNIEEHVIHAFISLVFSLSDLKWKEATC